jgi:hypothetical protein
MGNAEFLLLLENQHTKIKDISFCLKGVKTTYRIAIIYWIKDHRPCHTGLVERVKTEGLRVRKPINCPYKIAALRGCRALH